MSSAALVEQARMDAVYNIAAAIVAAANTELGRHGLDPSLTAILACGFARAIVDIDQGAPGFAALVDIAVKDGL